MTRRTTRAAKIAGKILEMADEFQYVFMGSDVVRVVNSESQGGHIRHHGISVDLCSLQELIALCEAVRGKK